MLLLKDLTYHPAATPLAILKDINLELAPQQLGLVIGASGSGKSTLLEVLAGLAQKSAGKILWRDQELSPDQLQQLAGLVFQFPERHFCGHTLLEELRLGHPELNKERIDQALAAVGLGHLPLTTSPRSLSGGQQRRLALAVQLIRQPYLLLLDEPTAGLDWSMRQQVINLLTQLKKQWTLLVVSHEPGEMVSLADRCWTLNHGELATVDPSIFVPPHQRIAAQVELGGVS
ncbi:MAG: energy-coupling factor ABC transporter ATP-binding protein [Elainella sp. Prado103]|jgi:energy-coupling factor transport system ATP-binding protein|nr:energy-coupling factor ABC transporter ATP-binding protein [Elainella sp. Prado103]